MHSVSRRTLWAILAISMTVVIVTSSLVLGNADYSLTEVVVAILMVATMTGVATAAYWRISARRAAAVLTESRRLATSSERRWEEELERRLGPPVSDSGAPLRDILTAVQEVREGLAAVQDSQRKILNVMRSAHRETVGALAARDTDAQGIIQDLASLKLTVEAMESVVAGTARQGGLRQALGRIEALQELTSTVRKRIDQLDQTIGQHSHRVRNTVVKERKPLEARVRYAETRMLGAMQAQALLHADALEALTLEVAGGREASQEAHVTHRAHLSDIEGGQLQILSRQKESQESLDRMVSEQDLLKQSVREMQETIRAGETSLVKGLGERAEALEASLEDVLDRAQSRANRHATQVGIDTVRQVEALLQLMPRVSTASRRLPSSGGWAMSAGGILLLSDLLLRDEPGTVVELGSGASTVWMGAFATAYGGRIISFDHEKAFADRTMELLDEHGVADHVEVRTAQLVETHWGDSEYRWYDPAAFRDIRAIDLLVVDGPPQSSGPQERFPALPILADFLNDMAWIVVDDYQRQSEKRMVQEWLTEYPFLKEHPSDDPRVGLLRCERSR